jgi:hypothetical protein
MVIYNVLRIYGICYDHLVHFVFIWYIFSGLGILHQEKSGNPGVVVITAGAEDRGFESRQGVFGAT